MSQFVQNVFCLFEGLASLTSVLFLFFIHVKGFYYQLIGSIVLLHMLVTWSQKVLFETTYEVLNYAIQNDHLFGFNLRYIRKNKFGFCTNKRLLNTMSFPLRKPWPEEIMFLA